MFKLSSKFAPCLSTTTQRSPVETEGSNRSLARVARAVPARTGATRGFRKTETARACLRKGEQEEAEGRREQAAKKARGPLPPRPAARSPHPDRGTSHRPRSRLSPAFRREQFSSLPRDH